MKISLSMRMQMRAAPQLVLAGKFLQASDSALGEMLAREVQDNPALELKYHARSMLTGLHNTGWQLCLEDLAETLAARPKPFDLLWAQIGTLLSYKQREIAEQLLYALDAHGFLPHSDAELAADLGVKPDQVRQVRQCLMELEPAGIGARDARECLLAQCAHYEPPEAVPGLAMDILRETWHEFLHQQPGRMARKLGEPRSKIEAALGFITRHLHPYPLNNLNETSTDQGSPAAPDLVILRAEPGEKTRFVLEIPGEEAFELRLCAGFANPVHSTDNWMRMHVQHAQLALEALHQRWGTLRSIGEFIITRQESFLEHGRSFLKPFNQASLAEHLGLHPSTISRALQNKFIRLPDGELSSLAALFDPGVALRENVLQVIASANRPLNDQEVAERLEGLGIHLARRTVSKYRRQLQIVASFHRKTGIHSQGKIT